VSDARRQLANGGEALGVSQSIAERLRLMPFCHVAKGDQIGSRTVPVDSHGSHLRPAVLTYPQADLVRSIFAQIVGELPTE
jgi:hypothetical protein